MDCLGQSSGIYCLTLHPDIERCALIGWRLYPASNRTRAACFKGATDAATYDLNQLARWSADYPNCNWRVVMTGSNIWGLDCDTPPIHAHDGVSALAQLVQTHGPLPPRPTVRSGGGGLAIFFDHKAGEKIIGDSGHPAPGIDPRRGRQSQTIPPSIHTATRRPYRWLVEPWQTAPPVAPTWLLKLVQPPPEPNYKSITINTSDIARRRLYRAASIVAQADAGRRNDVLNRRSFQIGCMIATGYLSEQEAIEALYSAARAAGLAHIEAKATIKSGVNSGLRKGHGDLTHNG